MGKYKLIHDFEKGSRELYDLEADIGETNDIAKDNPQLTDCLYHILDQWRKENSAIMMTEPNPDWDNQEPIVQ